jgi:8-oxo-dGTP pyrophosphatase MutT (NUDIX family)
MPGQQPYITTADGKRRFACSPVAIRETREEAGEQVRVRPLGTVHISTFHYGEDVRYMLSVGYLMVYEGGGIQPGDDMAESR